MSIKNNTTELQAILAIVDNLPEAGSGECPEPVLQEKTVTPNTSNQEVTPNSGYDGLSKVTVEAIPSEYIVPNGTKNITANGNHDVKNYASVAVDVPIPDGYIKPSGNLTIDENGEYDVTEKASVTVSIELPEPTEPILQSKTVTPTTSSQSVTPDTGYDGLSKVTVEAIPSEYVQPSGTLTVTENGTHDVKNYASVNVNVASSGGGSGSVEVVPVNIVVSNEIEWHLTLQIYYMTLGVDGNIVMEKYETSVDESSEGTVTLNILKGSLCLVQSRSMYNMGGWFDQFESVNGEAERIGIDLDQSVCMVINGADTIRLLAAE